MKDTTMPNMRYDFSVLSKNRLRTYNMLAEELDRQSLQDSGVELDDSQLEMLSAAGDITALSAQKKE